MIEKLRKPRGKLCKRVYWNEHAIPTKKKYEVAVAHSENVDCIPKRKTIRLVNDSKKGKIFTEYFEDMADAKKMLKVSAAYLDCNVVVEVFMIGRRNQSEIISTRYGKVLAFQRNVRKTDHHIKIKLGEAH